MAVWNTTSSLTLNSGGRGRPPSRFKAMIRNQCDLHSWFKTSSLLSTTSSKGFEIGKPDSILSLLCWGYWKKTTSYGRKIYDVQGLLQDSKSGTNWVPEPTTFVEFMFDGRHVVVDGCFRHAQCSRLSATRAPFPNF